MHLVETGLCKRYNVMKQIHDPGKHIFPRGPYGIKFHQLFDAVGFLLGVVGGVFWLE